MGGKEAMIPMLRLISRSAPFLLIAVAAPSARADDPRDVPTFADRSDRDVSGDDRTFGVLLNPLAAAVGVYGAETDFVLGPHLAASIEGAFYRLPGSPTTALGSGLLVYPGAVFHGLYLAPRVVYARPLGEELTRFDLRSDVLGAGATAGWQWTWDYGLTVRLGAGGMYFAGGSGAGGVPLGGPELAMDGSVGWTF
jgi:hypothetical protein